MAEFGIWTESVNSAIEEMSELIASSRYKSYDDKEAFRIPLKEKFSTWFDNQGIKAFREAQADQYYAYIEVFKELNDNRHPILDNERMTALKQHAFESLILEFKKEFKKDIAFELINVIKILKRLVENCMLDHEDFTLIQTEVTNQLNAEKDSFKEKNNCEMSAELVSDFVHSAFEKMKQVYPDKANLIEAHLELQRQFKIKNGPCGEGVKSSAIPRVSTSEDKPSSPKNYGRLYQPALPNAAEKNTRQPAVEQRATM